MLNYADLIAGERNVISLNLLVEPCVCNGASNDFAMENKKEIEERHSEDNAHYNKGDDANKEWQKAPSKQR